MVSRALVGVRVTGTEKVKENDVSPVVLVLFAGNLKLSWCPGICWGELFFWASIEGGGGGGDEARSAVRFAVLVMVGCRRLGTVTRRQPLCRFSLIRDCGDQ